MVGLVCDLNYLLLLGLGCRGPLIIFDEGPIQRGSPSESSVDVDEVLNLGEMTNPSLNMTVEVGVDNNPANAIGKGAFVVDRDSVLGKMIVENRPPVTNEVGRARDMTLRALSEAAFSETSASVDHSEDIKMFRKFEGIFE